MTSLTVRFMELFGRSASIDDSPINILLVPSKEVDGCFNYIQDGYTFDFNWRRSKENPFLYVRLGSEHAFIVLSCNSESDLYSDVGSE